MTARRMILVVSAALGLASASQAQLVGYDFFGSTQPNVSQAATVNSGLITTASPITEGSGIQAQSVPNSMTASNFASGFNASNYFTFTLTPSTGLNNVVVTLFAQRAATGPTTVDIRSNANGDTTFATSLATGTVSTTAGTVTLTLPSTFTFSSATEFRIFGYGASNAGSQSTLSFLSPSAGQYGVALSATAVPEGETYVLSAVGLGLVGGGFCVKKRRASLAVA